MRVCVIPRYIETMENTSSYNCWPVQADACPKLKDREIVFSGALSIPAVGAAGCTQDILST